MQSRRNGLCPLRLLPAANPLPTSHPSTDDARGQQRMGAVATASNLPAGPVPAMHGALDVADLGAVAHGGDGHAQA
jgi:hypothetical protein